MQPPIIYSCTIPKSMLAFRSPLTFCMLNSDYATIKFRRSIVDMGKKSELMAFRVRNETQGKLPFKKNLIYKYFL